MKLGVRTTDGRDEAGWETVSLAGSTGYERQARPLKHRTDSPDSSQFECEA